MAWRVPAGRMAPEQSNANATGHLNRTTMRVRFGQSLRTRAGASRPAAGPWCPTFDSAPSRHLGVISTKQTLFAVAPAALRIVRRPSETVAVDVPSTHRDVLVEVPFTVNTPSTAIL